MITEPALLHQQEVRRQAMLQAMQLDVWLPRQSLLNAAPSRDYLLDWQNTDAAITELVEPLVSTVASVSPVVSAPEPPAVVAPRVDTWVSVRDKLALTPSTHKPTVAVPVATATVPVDEQAAPALSVPAEGIPRFALQLLRADNCLILADLPTGEAFQSRDPDYQLLKDMLKAAGLTDQPIFLRQAAPITWPMLLSGNLMHEQNASAARACVRDLLSVELQSSPAVCIWLLGKQAVRFASAADDSELYALQPFVEGAQLWCLPSFENVLERPMLKRDIWNSMCAVRALWQVTHA